MALQAKMRRLKSLISLYLPVSPCISLYLPVSPLYLRLGAEHHSTMDVAKSLEQLQGAAA